MALNVLQRLVPIGILPFVNAGSCLNHHENKIYSMIAQDCFAPVAKPVPYQKHRFGASFPGVGAQLPVVRVYAPPAADHLPEPEAFGITEVRACT